MYVLREQKEWDRGRLVGRGGWWDRGRLVGQGEVGGIGELGGTGGG